MKAGPTLHSPALAAATSQLTGRGQHLPALFRWVVVDHVDDAAGGVERGAGRQGDGQVTGVGPEPRAGQGGHLQLLGQLRLGDAFCGPYNDSPLWGQGEEGDGAEWRCPGGQGVLRRAHS